MDGSNGLMKDVELVQEEIDVDLKGGRVTPGLLNIKKEPFERGSIEPGFHIELKNAERGINEGDIYILNKSRGRSGTVGEFFKAVRVIADKEDVWEFVNILLRTTALEHLYYGVLRYLNTTVKTADNQFYYESRERKRGLLEGRLKETLPVYSEYDLIAIQEAYGFKSELELLGIKYTSQKRVDESQKRVGDINRLEHEDLERELILRVFKNDSIPKFKGAFRISKGYAGGSYLCMEFSDGDDLDSIIEDEERRARQGDEVKVEVAFAIVCKSLRAVEELHKPRYIGGVKIGYSHNDIDESNTLITNEGDVLLIDYSTIQRFEYEKDMRPVACKPVGYKFAGKIYYMSPEFALYGLVHPQNDIHAAGVVLYKMITGRYPFDHASATREKIAEVIRRGKTRKMSKIMGKDKVPEEADDIVLNAFKGGYKSVLDFQHALSKFLEKRGITGDYSRIITDPYEGLVGYKQYSALRTSQYRVLQELKELKETADIKEFRKFSTACWILNKEAPHKKVIDAYYKAKEEDKVQSFIKKHEKKQ